MYEGAITNFKMYGGVTYDFPISMGLHQGFALSRFLFAAVKDEITWPVSESKITIWKLCRAFC